jgi:hypothetical protein
MRPPSLSSSLTALYFPHFKFYIDNWQLTDVQLTTLINGLSCIKGTVKEMDRFPGEVRIPGDDEGKNISRIVVLFRMSLVGSPI